MIAVLGGLGAARRLRLTRAALPLVITAGLCEVGGFASYAVGARHGIAISAVLASQFAALAALAAYLGAPSIGGEWRVIPIPFVSAHSHPTHRLRCSNEA